MRARGGGPWTVWSACAGREVTVDAHDLAGLDPIRQPAPPVPVSCVRCRRERYDASVRPCSCAFDLLWRNRSFWPKATEGRPV